MSSERALSIKYLLVPKAWGLVFSPKNPYRKCWRWWYTLTLSALEERDRQKPMNGYSASLSWFNVPCQWETLFQACFNSELCSKILLQQTNKQIVVKIGNKINTLWACSSVQPLQKAVWRVFKIFKVKLPCDSNIF